MRRKRRRKDSPQGRGVLCACTACSIRIFKYNRVATNFFHVWFKPIVRLQLQKGPQARTEGPHHFNRSRAPNFILSPLSVHVCVCVCVCIAVSISLCVWCTHCVLLHTGAEPVQCINIPWPVSADGCPDTRTTQTVWEAIQRLGRSDR